MKRNDVVQMGRQRRIQAFLDGDTNALKAADLPVLYSGLSGRQRVRVRALYKRKNGPVCAHCGEPLICQPHEKYKNDPINWDLFPKGFLRYPEHLHHDHVTDLTIGVVHAFCNAWLWQYKGE